MAWMVSMISTSAHGNIGTNLGAIFVPHEPQACEDKAQRQLGKGKEKGKKEQEVPSLLLSLGLSWASLSQHSLPNKHI